VALGTTMKRLGEGFSKHHLAIYKRIHDNPISQSLR